MRMLCTGRWLKASGFQEQTHLFLGNRIDGVKLMEMEVGELDVDDAAVAKRLANRITALVRRTRKMEEEEDNKALSSSLGHEEPSMPVHGIDASSPRSQQQESHGLAGHASRGIPGDSLPGQRRSRPQQRKQEKQQQTPDEKHGNHDRHQQQASKQPRRLGRSGRSMSELSNYSFASSTGDTSATRTTLPSIATSTGGGRARSSAGFSTNTGSAHFVSREDIADRLHTLFHDQEGFLRLAESCMMARTNQLEASAKKRAREHRVSQTSLFGGENEVQQRQRLAKQFTLYEFHHLLVREGIIPSHLGKKHAIKIYAQAVKMEPCGGDMNRRGFQQALRLVAVAMDLPRAKLQMPQLQREDKDKLIFARARGGESLGLGELCNDNGDQADMVEKYIMAKEKRDRVGGELTEDQEEGRVVLNFLRTREERLRRIRVAHEADSATVSTMKKTLRQKMQALGIKHRTQFQI